MKKKLIHVTSAIVPGGVEQGLLTLVREGFYDGFDFRIVELSRGNGFMRDAIVKEIGDDRLISLTDTQKSTSTSRHPIKRSIRIARKSMHLPHMAWNLRSLFKELNPNTIVLSNPIVHLVGRVAAFACSDIKVGSFEHGTDTSVFPFRQALRLTSLRNDFIFGDAAQTLQKRVPSHYLGHKPEYVVPLAVLEPDTNRPPHNPDTFKILSLGRLSHEKNFPELAHAAAQLMREGQKIELTIGGDGPERKKLENLISDLETANPGIGIAANIKLPGFVTEKEDLRALRRAADIYVQPSLNEGFCLAAAEALAAGIPTATTDFGGSREWGTKDNMLKIQGFSRTHIADTLRYMIDHYREIAPAMSQAAVATAMTSYSREAVLKQWEPTIAKLMEPRHRLMDSFRARYVSHPSVTS